MIILDGDMCYEGNMMHWEGNDTLDGGKACLGEGSFEVRLDVKKIHVRRHRGKKTFQAEQRAHAKTESGGGEWGWNKFEIVKDQRKGH